MEVVSLGPEFAIEREIFWKCRFDIVRWIKLIPVSRVELLAVPDAPDAIQLLAHVPACRVMPVRIVGAREHALKPIIQSGLIEVIVCVLPSLGLLLADSFGAPLVKV